MDLSLNSNSGFQIYALVIESDPPLIFVSTLIFYFLQACNGADETQASLVFFLALQIRFSVTQLLVDFVKLDVQLSPECTQLHKTVYADLWLWEHLVWCFFNLVFRIHY